MPTSIPSLLLVPSPIDDLGDNAARADLAVQLAKKANTNIGSPEWCLGGDFPQSWGTGGHFSEGWDHTPWLQEERRQVLALSNSFSRRRSWIFATKRKIGYGDGELPMELPTGWEPDGTPIGYHLVDGVKIWADDCEHFLEGQMLSLAEMEASARLDGLTWKGDSLPSAPASHYAQAECRYLQYSATGQALTWLGVRDAQQRVERPSDRVTARLLYMLVRTAKIVGLDGDHELRTRAFVEETSHWLMQGPHYQTSKEAGVMPYVAKPYFNPVHSYGYMIPVVYWLVTKFGKDLTPEQEDRFKSFLDDATIRILSYVAEDGATVWAANDLGVKGYMFGENGDRYTPAYEMFTALHIAKNMGRDVGSRITSIASRFDVNSPTFGPWLCTVDSNGNFKALKPLPD